MDFWRDLPSVYPNKLLVFPKRLLQTLKKKTPLTHSAPPFKFSKILTIPQLHHFKTFQLAHINFLS